MSLVFEHGLFQSSDKEVEALCFVPSLSAPGSENVYEPQSWLRMQ